MKPLDVWVTDHAPIVGSGHRQDHTIVAARSRAAAARLLGISSATLLNYGSITGNEEKVAVALAEPGQVFYRSTNAWGGDWQRAAIPEGGHTLRAEGREEI